MEPLESRQLFSGGPTVLLKIAPKSPTTSTGSIEYIVTYSDRDGVDASSIDNRDLRVTGPNGFVKYANPLNAISTNDDGTVRVIQYKMSPPGGSWNAADNGTYSIRMSGDGVDDNLGNFASAKLLGTFTVKIAGLQSVQSIVQTNAFSTSPIHSVATDLLDTI